MNVGDVAGSMDNEGYWRLCVNGQRYGAHRLAWLYMTGTLPKEEIDHIDTNPLNNSWGNLRKATRRQNVANTSMRSDNWSGFKGVSWSKKHRRWVAQANIGGKRKWLGYFLDARSAHKAYSDAILVEHGNFARP